MEHHELVALLDDVRAGRSEDDSIDWKRAFWKLDNPHGLKEFRKDITAFANSASTKDVRRIIIGYKEQRLYDAQLPCDESHLQQKLNVIYPPINVAFENHEVDGKKLLVVEVRGPFNRPYVATIGSDRFVWVRQGSSTVTASRHHLDEMYRVSSPQPVVAMQFLDEDDSPLDELIVRPMNSAKETAAALEKLRPSDADLAMIEDRRTILASALDEGATPSGLSAGLSNAGESILDAPATLAKQVDEAIALAEADPRPFERRFDPLARSQSVRFEVRNDGSAPAENLVAYVDCNDHAAFCATDTINDPGSVLAESIWSLSTTVGNVQKIVAWAAAYQENVERSADPSKRRLRRAGAAFGGLPSYVTQPFLGIAPSAPKQVRMKATKDGRLRIDLDGRLKHSFHQVVSDGEILLIPFLRPGEVADLDYTCHADNLPQPTVGTLRLRAVPV